MTTDLIFIGAGAFHEQVEIVNDINAVLPAYRVLGILDDNPDLQGRVLDGTKVLGGLEKITDFNEAKIVLGVGSNRERLAPKTVVDKLALPMDRYETLIHPAAQVYRSAKIGAGAIIYAGAVIGNGTVVGDFAKVIWNAVIGADNVIGNGVSVCANATTCSGVKVGSYSFLASQCAIADGVTIGPMAKIGLGAVVARDVEPGAFMLGNPARKIDSHNVPPAALAAWE